MRTFVLELKEQLERDLDAVHSDKPHTDNTRKWQLTQAAFWKLQSLVDKYPFANKDDEISYFKHEPAPPISIGC